MFFSEKASTNGAKETGLQKLILVKNIFRNISKHFSSYFPLPYKQLVASIWGKKLL
jgi:hypothetical protein